MNPNTQNDLGRLLLRVTLGVLVLLHGIAKLNGGLSGIVGMVEAQGLPGVLGYAVIIGEVVAPLMLIAGFHARIGGLLVAINMLVAIVLVHAGELAGWESVQAALDNAVTRGNELLRRFEQTYADVTLP